MVCAQSILQVKSDELVIAATLSLCGLKDISLKLPLISSSYILSSRYVLCYSHLSLRLKIISWSSLYYNKVICCCKIESCQKSGQQRQAFWHWASTTLDAGHIKITHRRIQTLSLQLINITLSLPEDIESKHPPSWRPSKRSSLIPTQYVCLHRFSRPIINMLANTLS